jgi:carbamoyltransferase
MAGSHSRMFGGSKYAVSRSALLKLQPISAISPYARARAYEDFLKSAGVYATGSIEMTVIVKSVYCKRSNQAMDNPVILGVICHQGHSASAALLVGGRLVAAASEERFSRKKEDGGFPHRAIRFVLGQTGIAIQDVDVTAFAWNPWLSLRKHAQFAIGGLPWTLPFLLQNQTRADTNSRVKKFVRMVGLRRDFRRHFGHCPRVRHVEHHLAHAAAACYQSGFRDGACLVNDGYGEYAPITAYAFENGAFTKILEIDFPHSLGIFYSAITDLLDMRAEIDDYRVMGMAPYGCDARFHEEVRKLVALSDENIFALNLEYFLHQRSGKIFKSTLIKELLGPLDSSWETKTAIAASAQAVLEESVLHLVRHVKRRLAPRAGARSGLCFSGGVALNCVLNQKLRESALFSNFYFSPIAADAGTAVGAAQYVHHAMSGSRPAPVRRLDLGPEYSEDEIARALARHDGLRVERVDSPELAAARLLADSKVVAWFQGRMEFGPRALGHRSILADPRRPGMKVVLNRKIKTRESYLPFAPAVAHESFDRFFSSPLESRDFPYMIETVSAKQAALDLIPAAVHVDGTCRVQTVKESDNAPFYRLLKHFEALTGVPVVLNTSFNRSDEPIVASPEDAIAAFMGSGIDFLVIGNFLAGKK